MAEVIAGNRPTCRRELYRRLTLIYIFSTIINSDQVEGMNQLLFWRTIYPCWNIAEVFP